MKKLLVIFAVVYAIVTGITATVVLIPQPAMADGGPASTYITGQILHINGGRFTPWVVPHAQPNAWTRRRANENC